MTKIYIKNERNCIIVEFIVFYYKNINKKFVGSVMEQAIFTTLCMVYDNQDQILVQERKGTAWDGIAFPGGHVEQGESFVESVIREVFEETGYQISNPILCGVKQFQIQKDVRYVIFLYKTNQFTGNLHYSSEGNVFWIKRQHMQDYVLAVDMKEMMELFENNEKTEFYRLKNGSYKIL